MQAAQDIVDSYGDNSVFCGVAPEVNSRVNFARQLLKETADVFCGNVNALSLYSKIHRSALSLNSSSAHK